MSGLRARLGAIGGFGLFGVSVILNGVVSLVAIPAVTLVVGADRWASMATGQSIGQSIGVLVIFGWGLTGPALIASAAPADRPRLFLDSLLARAALFIPLVVVQAVITMAIVPHAKVIAFVSGVAMTLAGLSANWFFSGEQRPDRFLLLDTLPRVGGTVLGVVLVVSTGNLELFAFSQLAGSVVALVVSAAVVLRGGRLDVRAACAPRRILASIRDQRHGVVATGLYAAYMPALLAVVAVTSPVELPLFVLADRVGKFIQMAVSPLNQVYQGWVPAARGRELARRLRVSGLITVAVAVVGGTGDAVLLPAFSQVLTHGQVIYQGADAIAFGVLAATAIVSPWVTNVGLVTVRRVRFVAYSTVAGVPTTIGLVVLAQLLTGPDLAAWAFALGNLAIICWQVAELRRSARPLETAPESEPLASVASPA